MPPEARTRCHVTVRQSSVEVNVTRSDGVLVGHAEGAFNASKALRRLTGLPCGSAAEVQAYGRTLYDLLFSDTEVKTAFLQCETIDPNAGVQVCIELQDKLAPELRNLRWETLCDQTLPNPRRLAVEKPFRLVRRLGSVPVVNLQPLSDRPRVLVIISNPKNLEGYQTPEGYTFKPIEHPITRAETKALDALMADLQQRRQIQGYQILGGGLGPPHPDGFPSLARIRQVLDEAKKAHQPHHILHFLAHGYLDPSGTGHLILADENGKAVSVAQSEFLNLLPPEHQVQLVIFAACQSDQQALERPLAGLAPSMLQKGVGIPAVIAMQEVISIGAAATFGQAFYRDLGQHGYIDTALATARAEVAIRQPDEWEIPVLYLQNENPCLFDPDVKEAARQLTVRRFATASVEHFVNRGNELTLLASSLCKSQTPTFCWLWGPKMVGKKYLLQQLRFVAHSLGYGHLAYFARDASSKIGESKILYEVLRGLVIKGLEEDPERGECLKRFLKPRTENDSPKEIVNFFLDGLEKYANHLDRGLACFFHFYDFAAHEKLLSGPFKELVGEVTDRYLGGQLNRVRFVVAVGCDRSPSTLFPDAPGGFFLVHELVGFEIESMRALCASYGFVKDDQVPAEVVRVVQQSKLPDRPPDRPYYLPKSTADWLGQHLRLVNAGLLSLQELQWAPLDSGGG